MKNTPIRKIHQNNQGQYRTLSIEGGIAPCPREATGGFAQQKREGSITSWNKFIL
jgi:hypothetical protein